MAFLVLINLFMPIFSVMKRFLLKLAVFAIGLVVIDVIVGQAFSYMVAGAKSGDNLRNNYIIDGNQSDIVILGSSRALHHYNPLIFEDSLNQSCYNCGQLGNGIILNYAISKLSSERYIPKMIIYDVMPEYDLLVGEDNHKYLGILRPYYEREGMIDVFEDVDKTEKWKMRSYLYKYNSKLYPVLRDYLRTEGEDPYKGFKPEFKELDPLQVSEKQTEAGKYTYDLLKMLYLQKLCELYPKSTKIIFVVSPIYNGLDSVVFKPVKDLCKVKNLMFLDFSNNPKYVHHVEYFRDGGHMNARGAEEFSKELSHLLKSKCNESCYNGGW